jgi:mannose-1-phosphate guanylyltransferase/phosphomannomutase
MRAVILAAGKGERLGAITQNIPKPMIKIAGKPVLEHNVLMCKNNGVDDILINLHYLPLTIKNYFGDGNKWGVNINYIYETKLLGTAGTVRNSKDLLNMPFFVIYGDNYFSNDFDMCAIRKFHEKNHSDFTIVLSQLDDISQSGIVELTSDCKISRFIEKPINVRSNNSWVNAGMYFMVPKILEKIDNGYSDFANDVIPLLIDDDFNVYGYKMIKKVLPIDTPELLEKSINN